MIQRIQTIYLLLAEVLIGVLFFVPLANISTKENLLYRFDIQGIFQEGASLAATDKYNWLIILFWAVCFILLLTSIFMFRNRKKQIRFSVITLLCCLSLDLFVLYNIWNASQMFSGNFSLTIYYVFPVISSVLIFLAIKAIEKDELLVRSIDRIR